MQVTFLGTSAGVPTRTRNVSCIGLRLPQRGEVWLFDCGEGTQHQLIRSDLRISQISRIFITHLHGDHIFGLPGLLATSGMAGPGQRIEVYGPPRIDEYVRDTASHSQTRLSPVVRVHTVESGIILRDGDFTVSCLPLKHRVPTVGYRVAESDQPGTFNVEKAVESGIPPGPLYGRLKRGDTITLPDGRTVHGEEFSGPFKPGRRVVYCTDTIFCPAAIELSRDADILIHEATFAQADEDLARQSMHSTAAMAARVAHEAGARRLIITHISPRYVEGQQIGPAELLAEARSIFPDTEMARDFLTVEVKRPAASG